MAAPMIPAVTAFRHPPEVVSRRNRKVSHNAAKEITIPTSTDSTTMFTEYSHVAFSRIAAIPM
jgi:hypothetical protein